MKKTNNMYSCFFLVFMILSLSNASLLKARTGLDGEFIPSLSENFQMWKEEWKFPTPGQGKFQFKAKYNHDLLIALSPSPSMVNPMYELVIGGWGNTRSVVRNRVAGEEICFFNGIGILNPSDFDEYTINVDSNSNSITVWSNGRLLFSCVDNRFNLPSIQYFSFATCCGVNPLVAGVKSGPLTSTFNVQRFTPNKGPGDATFPGQFVVTKYHGYPQNAWKPEWALPQESQGRITFKAKMDNDLTVAIAPGMSENGPLYELVIGGWGNTRTVMRNRKAGDEICFQNYGFQRGGIIPNKDWNDYVIDIDSNNKSVYVWINRVLMFTCTDRKNWLSNVKYFAFAYCCGPTQEPLVTSVQSLQFNGYNNFGTSTTVVQPPIRPTNSFKIRGYLRNQVDAPIDETIINSGKAKVQFIDASGNVREARILQGGIYEIDLPPGTYTRVGEIQGYIRNTRTIQINLDSNETNLENRILMSEFFDGWKIVLTWNGVVKDLDGIIITPDGYKVVYNNRFSPDGKVTLDKDVTTGYGPETMSLKGITTGVYQYWIKNYSTNFMIKDAEGVVTLYRGNEELAKIRLPTVEERLQTLHVFDILPEQQTYKIINQFAPLE